MAKMAKNDERKQLKSLNKYLERLTDPKNIFFLGIVRGLGAAIGATVVAGIIFWVLTRVFGTVDDIPVLKDFVDNINQAIGND